MTPKLKAEICKAAIPLPVQPQDQHRVDEKYSRRGYNTLDARMGTDFNSTDERVG